MGVKRRDPSNESRCSVGRKITLATYDADTAVPLVGWRLSRVEFQNEDLDADLAFIYSLLVVRSDAGTNRWIGAMIDISPGGVDTGEWREKGLGLGLAGSSGTLMRRNEARTLASQCHCLGSIYA